MKKNFWEWIGYFFLLIWQLPQNIVGLLFLFVLVLTGSVKKIESTKWSTAFEADAMGGGTGISLGVFCFLSKVSAMRPASIAHELKGHTWDSRLMGPLYLFIVGIPSLLNAACHFTECYYDFYTEARSNRHAGLGVNENCRLYFLNDEKKEL